MMMTMSTTMMKKMTRPSIIHFLAALSLVLSFHRCACTQLYGNTIHADFYSSCSHNPSGLFYECGDPAGRCICQDHTAYCNVSSPALPVLPDDVHVLDLCNDYFRVHFLDGDTFQLTSQFFSHLKNVTELRIFSYKIRPKAFVQLANVTKFIFYCSYKHLKQTLVNFLLVPNLRSLGLYNCDLKRLSLHPGLQSPLHFFSAKWCFTDNGTWDLKVFQMFKDLKRISFKYSKINQVQPAVLPGLEELILDDNKLTSFPQTCDMHNNSFFPSLKRMSLSNNNISHIGGISITLCSHDQVHPAALPALEELILDGNELTTFPQACDMHNNSFFPSLKRISLSRNKISQIGGKGFAACLPQVTEIDASNNPITRIQKGVFDAQSCPNLETVNISSERGYDNPPTIHTEGFIFANPSIKTLDLTNRRWKFGRCTPENCVAQNTFANSSLTHLYLDENDFGDVDSFRFFELFGGLRNLTYLSVRNSNFFALRILDRRFCDFPLQYLDLSNTPRVCKWIDKSCHNSKIKIVKADKANSWEYSVRSSYASSYGSAIIHTDPVTCAVYYTFELLRFALMGSAIEHISFRENNLDFGQRCTENETSCVFSNSFENKPNLTVLLLDGNDFNTVDSERFVSLFGKLTNLKNLSLSNCGIKHVSAEMFHGFPRLQYLDLSINKFNTLSSQTFFASPSLNVLYLHSNVLSVVPEGLFSSDQRRGMTKFTLYQNPLVCSCDNHWLQSWLLSDPDLFQYPSQSYSCFDDPTKSLANYTMPDQDMAVFTFFKDLKRISITFCSFDQVYLASLPALEELVLDYNSLTSFLKTCDVHNNSFFPSLKRLSLLYKTISQIGGEGSATCLPQVTEIVISYDLGRLDKGTNDYFSIKKGLFDAQSCPKLEIITIRQERFVDGVTANIHTEDYIFSNPSIRTLNLTNSGWNFGRRTPESCVTQNTFANSSLTHLILDGNEFSDVDSDRFLELFGGLRNLFYLSLEKTHFVLDVELVLRITICQLNLQYLSLSYSSTPCPYINAVNQTCHNTMKTFKADKVVSVKMEPESCLLSRKHFLLRSAFVGSVIEHVSFRDNSIDFGHVCLDSDKDDCILPESFKNKPDLRVLLLDGNDFSDVDAERFVSLFGNLTNLEHFSLSNCDIKHVSAEMFHGFPRLQYLDLNNNKLTTLSSQTFSASPSLNVLYLHDNVLSVVPEGLFSSNQRRGMTKFTLYQNKLVCSCDNRWLQSWLLSDPDLFDYPSQSYRCFDDPTKSLATYTMPDQACMLGQDAAIAIIITSTVTIAALTAFSLLFRYRWSFRLLLYYALSNRDKNRARRRNYVYDVFVSYDQEDFEWVSQQLMPELENRMGLRVCIHQRDFIPGHYIVTNITQAVEHSKKVLMVFSRHFVLSRWCQFEVDFCLSNAIENSDSLLIVCLDDVASDETLLTGAMKAALSTMTYIQWVNRRDAIHFFWERVRQSLGDVRPRDREAGRRRLREVLDPDGRVRIEIQVMDF